MRLQKNTSLTLYIVLEFASDPARHVSAAEIDEDAKATFSSITLATMLGLIERQKAAVAAAEAVVSAARSG